MGDLCTPGAQKGPSRNPGWPKTCRNGRRLVVHNQAIAFILQKDKFSYCCWDQHGAGNEVFFYLGYDLFF